MQEQKQLLKINFKVIKSSDSATGHHSTTHPVKSTHFSLVSHNKEDSFSLFPIGIRDNLITTNRTRIAFQMLRVMLSVILLLQRLNIAK